MSEASTPSTEQPELDIEKGWTNPFTENTPLWQHFEDVISQDRDLIIVLDDYRARRGTGKTVASIQLAAGMDQTEEGLTKKKVSLDVEEIRTAYSQEKPRSGMVIDEAEVGAGNRDAMTKTNKALREIMSMGRVEQKYVVVNTPAKKFIDKDILRLCDIWITMTRRGQALVHSLEHHPYSGQLYTPKIQWLDVPDIQNKSDLHQVYRYLDKEKRKRIAGEGATTFVTEKEHKEELKKVRKKAQKEKRDAIIKELAAHPGVEANQSAIGECVGLDRSTVSKIINS